MDNYQTPDLSRKLSSWYDTPGTGSYVITRDSLLRLLRESHENLGVLLTQTTSHGQYNNLTRTYEDGYAQENLTGAQEALRQLIDGLETLK
jgi:hypothetical protein